MTSGQTIRSIKGSDPVVWRQRVGRMHVRNNILAWKDTVILSTSGDVWNESDEKDGVVCVDRNTGQSRWFLRTSSDANEVFLLGNTITCGTDDGELIAIDADTGTVLAKFKAESRIVARSVAVKVRGDLTAVAISVAGEVLAYGAENKTFRSLGKIPGDFRANPVTSGALSERGLLIAATESGRIIEINVSDELRWRELHQIEAAKPSIKANYLLNLRGAGSLVIEGDMLIVSYARVTMDETPPIRAISLITGAVIWRARAVKTVSKRPQMLGNSRITPVIWNGQLITTLGYSDSLYSFSLNTGAGLWKLRLDDGLFQNWASPVLHGNVLYVARVNGLLITVDLTLRAILRSLSLEFPYTSATDDQRYHRDEDTIWRKIPWPELQSTGLSYSGPAAGQPLTAGLASTPLCLDGHLYVGTVSGDLCAIIAGARHHGGGPSSPE
ncbi:hypothetical protein A9174_03735 [Mesorhizobium loti NZP2037]|nr:PQQ-binding-like beta-propeller repeat protein [Mesorhizobium loti]ANN55965.1 hypothetical protein A9174_03735 [Mesorhizobium loti NZP2037]